jgi:hypothetical protein
MAAGSLKLARRVDHTVNSATQLMVMLQKGPYKRRRRRTRKKLQRLIDVLNTFQRIALTEPPGEAPLLEVFDSLKAADHLLERSMHAAITKSRLRKIRRGATAHRQSFEAIMGTQPESTGPRLMASYPTAEQPSI